MLAYIDPGSGSLILQTIIAGVVGGLVYFRNAIWRIFKRSKPSDEQPKPSAKETELETHAK